MKLLTKDIYKQIIQKPEIIIIFFENDNCGGCKMMKPVIESLEEQFETYIVNTSEENKVTSFFNISSIPTTVIVKNKKIIAKEIGYRPKEYLINIIKTI